MEKTATVEEFKQAIIQQHMPDDRLAQQALGLAIEMLLYSIWLAKEHKKQDGGSEQSFIIPDA